MQAAGRSGLRAAAAATPRRCVDGGSRRAATAAAAEKRREEKGVKQSNSFLMNAFRGNLESAQVMPYPVMAPERLAALGELVGPVERFFAEVNDPARNDRDAQVEPATLQGLWELGAFALQVPQDLGGLGLNNSQYARLVEVVGAHDLGVGIVLGAHQSIGFKGILLFGTPEQKEKYLPRVAGGEFAAFALTEPASGSDASSIKTRAELSADGSHYVLNGSKIWISNGGIAEIMTVFAQTPVQKDGKTVDKVSAFIVERSFGGVTSGPPEDKMGIKCSNTAEVYFEDVRVPKENVLGQPGDGFKVAMQILNNGRFGMAAALAGTQRAAIRAAASHAATRHQFGRTIAGFQGVQERLGTMAARQYATESVAYMVSGNMDAGAKDYHLEAAAGKVLASENAWATVDDAIQVLAGMGYMKGTGLERVLRDLRIFRIFEGTNDILRLFIALTGVQFAGSSLKELQRAFSSPAANLGLIFSEAGRRAATAVGLSGPPALPGLHATLQPAGRELGACVTALGNATEAALRKYGRDVVEQQCVLNRLADAAIHLYAATAVLARASRPDVESSELALAATCAEWHVSRGAAAAAAAQDSRRMGLAARLATLGQGVAQRGEMPTSSPLGV